ncbi:putative sulfate transporter [Operophtera brumata]|uniref:Putative sulfate transporter n=1 Tax=Operophtera brumata TaxID=104452 RepID=A0A0L7LKA7_OPEBR|nr:putative sulfate transporter [Operophtera brumata]
MAFFFESNYGESPFKLTGTVNAVNHASGVATQFGGLYTGVLVLLALSLLTPYFYFIPKASLAAVVICAVIFMIEYELGILAGVCVNVILLLYPSARPQLDAEIVTRTATARCRDSDGKQLRSVPLRGVELGILAGVCVNMILLLYPSARPQLDAEIVTVSNSVLVRQRDPTAVPQRTATARCRDSDGKQLRSVPLRGVELGILAGVCVNVILLLYPSARPQLDAEIVTRSVPLRGVELGILAGECVNVILLLYPSARPQLDAEIVTASTGFNYVLVTVGNSLYFPGVEYIRQYVERAAKKQGGCSLPVVIDCRYVLARGQPLVLLSPRASVASVFSNAGSSVVCVLTQNELDSTLQKVIVGELNRTPLLNGNRNGTVRSHSSEVNDT